MGINNGMYTKTGNIIVCKFKGVIKLLVKLNEKDILVLYPNVNIVLDANLDNYEYLKLMQGKSLEPFKFYINKIKCVLSKGYTSRVVGLCKELQCDKNYILNITKLYVGCLIGLDTDIYTTLLVTDDYVLKQYLLTVSSRQILKGFRSKINEDKYIYKYKDILENIKDYELYISNMSVNDYIVSKLQGCCISKKGDEKGYHFTNLSYAEIDTIEYGCINDTRRYNCGNKRFNFVDVYTFDSLEVCETNSCLVKDLFSNINNIILLTDIIYAINMYNNKGIDIKNSFMLALLGLQQYTVCKNS